MLEINEATFRGQYLAANAPEVLFWRIEDCAKQPIHGLAVNQQCDPSPPDYWSVRQAI
jgi:hypothetical protein